MKTYQELMEDMQSKIAGMPPAKRAKAQAVLSANKASAKKVNAPQAVRPKAKPVAYGQQPKYAPHQGNKERARRLGGNKSSALVVRPNKSTGGPDKGRILKGGSALAKTPQSKPSTLAMRGPQSRTGPGQKPDRKSNPYRMTTPNKDLSASQRARGTKNGPININKNAKKAWKAAAWVAKQGRMKDAKTDGASTSAPTGKVINKGSGA